MFKRKNVLFKFSDGKCSSFFQITGLETTSSQLGSRQLTLPISTNFAGCKNTILRHLEEVIAKNKPE